MLTGLSKKIEVIANVAIIVVACLLAIVLVKNYFFTKASQQANESESQRVQSESQPVNSATVSSLEIDWKQSRQTLILAISSSCHFCTESAPFYKTLARSKGDTRIIALLPQPVEDGRKYLEKLGVSVDEVRQTGLEKIGVHGTPTVMLIDASGAVKNSWVGFLSPEAELDVLRAVKGD
jgi:thioredoxin-related protein